MKERVVIFGLGKLFGYAFDRIAEQYEIVALVDNCIKVLERHDQIKIYAPDEITGVEFDRVIITVYDLHVFEEMKYQLIMCGVEASKICMLEADIPEGEKEILDNFKKLNGVNIAEQPASPLVSQLARRHDIAAWSDRWCDGHGLKYGMDRKTWEFMYISQVLLEQNQLLPGNYGLGFAVGKEPLPALFACFGCKVTATDLRDDMPSSQGWARTNQHSSSLLDLHFPLICDESTLFANVRFIPLNMNEIPDDLNDFDFCWSSCAFEHLETVEQSKQFVLNTLELLKPGGISVHTTEFNLSSANNAGVPSDHVFGKDFFDELREEIMSMGHHFAPFDYRLGEHSDDDYVFRRSEELSPHFKLWSYGCIATSIGFYIVKAM